MTWLVVAVVCAAGSRVHAAPSPASLKAVAHSASPSGGELLLRIEGDYTFQTIQATDDTLLVDLKGVKAAGVARKGEWQGGPLGGYRLLEYTDAGGQPVARVLLDLRHAEPVTARQEAGGLRLLFGQVRAAASSAPAVPSPEPVRPSAAEGVGAEAPPGAAASGPAKVADVSIRTGEAGETVVDIVTTRPAQYNVFHLPNPPRLVIDLEGVQSAAKRHYPAESSVLKGVRVGQFRAENPAVVRVVADLEGSPLFDVHAFSGGVRIGLRPREAAQAQAPAPEAVTPAVKEEMNAEVAAAPTREEAAVATPPPAAETSEVKADTPAMLDVQTTLPAAISQEVVAAPKPETGSAAPEAVQAARAAMTLRGTTILAAAPQGQAPAGEEQPKYTGEPISLNLKDVDLKDFFRLVHEISGLNIIVDPNVAGNVTLVLDAVPWDQALDIVLQNNRLGKTLVGNVLRIARVDTLTAEQEAASKLAAAREEAQPLVTVFRPVNYAKGSTIATMLKAWVGGGALTRRGNILVDERTNTLIVSDIQTQIPVIAAIITKLDTKAKQVQIEARIVRASSDFTRNLAASLSAAYVNRSGSTITAGGTGTGSTANSVGNLPLVTTQPVSGFGVYAISNAGARYIINAAIAAAETRAQLKTISRPTIVTQNNIPGTVQQGVQIPIQTTINNTISITYINAALVLRVTPQVTEDGNIFLDIQVTNASPGPALTGAGPSINTQQATTQVLVPDGGTVVFGGVTVTTRAKSVTQVPLLGSIPLIGNLFRSSIVEDRDQELLFFVSPKVLPG